MRIALDTNVLVRLLTEDDPQQTRQARQLLRGNELYLSKTVLLESEWVLRYSYGIDRERIAQALERLLALEGAEIESRAAVARASDWYSRGLDFADALHLASSRGCHRLATFDRNLRNRSNRLSTEPEVELVGSA